MTTHNVEVNVTANTQQAQKSLNYLQSLMGEFGKQATNRFAAMFGAAAVAKMAFDKVSQAISANIATAKQVSQMAIKFNIDPVAMHSITMAAKDAGVSVRALTMSMKQLGKYAEKAMTSKDAQANFKQLGIDANKLNEIQAAPSKFLPEIAKALMEIGDENQRSAAGATLLGRQYQMLLPLIEELGTSEEARAKFLENQNAMTEEQIAANKEIAKIQNDLSDGFDKLVASVTPLLAWAMDFVNLLAKGVTHIKDMIFESDKARAAREEKESLDVTAGVALYRENLVKRKESGTLSEKDKAGIEKAGGVDEYVASQSTAMEEMELSRQKSEDFGKKRLRDLAFADGAKFRYHTMLMDEQRVITREKAKGVTKEFASHLGLDDSNTMVENDEARQRIASAAQKGTFKTIAKEGTDKAINLGIERTKVAEGKAFEERQKKYVELKKAQGAVFGQIYDPATDDFYGKKEYEQVLIDRGETKDSAKAQVRAFEKEEDRVKREKQTESSERKLAASERKLYVGDPSQGRYKQGLDEAEKAAEALEDTKEAQVEPLKDLNEQQGIFNDLANDLYIAQNANIYEGIENEADILRLTAQLEVEKVKLNDLQSKANDLKGQEIAAEENLKKAKESVYREELKRLDAVDARIKAEDDHEKQLKYKMMKTEGKSQRDITKERLKDEEAEYGAMLERYKKKYDEAMKNEAKGLKGEDLSEKEVAELEGLTKELDAKKRGILDTAFDLGNQEDKGQATSMRRIGGGGMEYGGLGNTAKQQLDVARRSLKKLEEIGILLNPKLQQIQGEKSGLTYGQFVSGVTASDSSPR